MNFIKEHKWIIISIVAALLIKPLLKPALVLPLLVAAVVGLVWFPILFWLAGTTLLNIYFGGILKRFTQ